MCVCLCLCLLGSSRGALVVRSRARSLGARRPLWAAAMAAGSAQTWRSRRGAQATRLMRDRSVGRARVGRGGASQAHRCRDGRGRGGRRTTQAAVHARAAERQRQWQWQRRETTYRISGARVGLDRDHKLAGIVSAGFLGAGHGEVLWLLALAGVSGAARAVGVGGGSETAHFFGGSGASCFL